MAAATAAQLIRIARLRHFVGVFARGGDREATGEALAELSQASLEAGLASDALKRARQAAELLTEAGEGASEAGVRALIHLGVACLDTGASDDAISAAMLADERAEALPEPVRLQLRGAAALIAGIAHAVAGAEAEARACLDDARERLVAAGLPGGAAIALTQQGLLEIAADDGARAALCFRFARDFHRAAGEPIAAAEVTAVAARAFADVDAPDATRWFTDGVVEADAAGAAQLAAELVVAHAERCERLDQRATALALATDGARRAGRLGAAGRELALRTRLQLARLVEDPRDALRHVEAAFEIGLDLQEPAALGAAMEIVVSGLVKGRFSDVGWKLVDRFHRRLSRAGFAALADTAIVALEELRP